MSEARHGYGWHGLAVPSAGTCPDDEHVAARLLVRDMTEALRTGWLQLSTFSQLEPDVAGADLQCEAGRAVMWCIRHAADAVQVDVLPLLDAQHLRQPQRVR